MRRDSAAGVIVSAATSAATSAAGGVVGGGRCGAAMRQASALTMSSMTFFASPKTIIVLSR